MSQVLDEYFIKGSDNKITLTLREDAVAISETPTELAIYIGDDPNNPVVTMTRAAPIGDGVSYAAGVVEITPADLTETLADLIPGSKHRVFIVVKTSADPNGVVFGQDDDEGSTELVFHVRKNPAA